jgi:hypothetical protein
MGLNLGSLACPAQVSAIFLWNIISYDVLGIHRDSTTSQGSYRDYQVSGMLTEHNAGVRG